MHDVNSVTAALMGGIFFYLAGVHIEETYSG